LFPAWKPAAVRSAIIHEGKCKKSFLGRRARDTVKVRLAGSLTDANMVGI